MTTPRAGPTDLFRLSWTDYVAPIDPADRLGRKRLAERLACPERRFAKALQGLESNLAARDVREFDRCNRWITTHRMPELTCARKSWRGSPRGCQRVNGPTD